MITIDLKSPVPLAEQIRRGIRQAIASGEVKAGDSLPPVRHLAADLGINFNTVARAYRDLEGEGLVLSRRGRGTVVTVGTAQDAPPTPESEERMSAAMRNLLADARLAGMSAEAIARMFQRELTAFDTTSGAES